MTFTEKLADRQRQVRSVLCVGLDPDVARIPEMVRSGNDAKDIVTFNRTIVESVAPFVCAFKLNFAFYEALGSSGWQALEETVDLLPNDVITIADNKRGDIGNSARFYAQSVFSHFGFDACTVAPYMGSDAVLPFLEWSGKAAFVLVRTSNKSADDFQLFGGHQAPLFMEVAEHVNRWNGKAAGTVGLVAGATRPDDLKRLRQHCPTAPFLVPGVGTQGGDPIAVVQAATTGSGLVLVNSSRAILYAGSDADFGVAAATQAEQLRRLMSDFQAPIDD